MDRLKYLKVSKWCFALVVIILTAYLIFGCGHIQPYAWQHNCVSNAIRDAWTYEQQTGLPSRIAIFNISKGVDHAQAQGQRLDGSWEYLTSSFNDLKIWDRHFDVKPYRYVTLDEFIAEQRRNFNLK